MPSSLVVVSQAMRSSRSLRCARSPKGVAGVDRESHAYSS